MSIQWAQDVSKKFYGWDGSPAENREAVKYKSGRVVYHKLNSAQKYTHAVKLMLDNKKTGNNSTEWERFLSWYENENGSGTVPVSLTIKGVTRDYYVTMENSSGQRYIEISLKLEEV